MHYANTTIEDKMLVLDDCSFTNVMVINCKMTYFGGPLSLTNTNFTTPSFRFMGNALEGQKWLVEYFKDQGAPGIPVTLTEPLSGPPAAVHKLLAMMGSNAGVTHIPYPH